MRYRNPNFIFLNNFKPLSGDPIFPNLVRYKLMLAAINSADQDLSHCLLSDFLIVGPILRSGRWPPYEKKQSPVAVALMQSRAWEIRKKIMARVQAVPITEDFKKIWDVTVEDAQEGSCIGPVFDQKDVSNLGRQASRPPTAQVHGPGPLAAKGGEGHPEWAAKSDQSPLKRIERSLSTYAEELSAAAECARWSGRCCRAACKPGSTAISVENG